MRVLLVEDNSVQLEALETCLRDLGVDVVGAGDGYGALPRLALGGFDAVVLDLWMPGLDGLTTLRRIRATADRTPVVVWTAAPECDLDTLERERDTLGPLVIVRKPADPEALLNAITNLVRSTGRADPT